MLKVLGLALALLILACGPARSQPAGSEPADAGDVDPVPSESLRTDSPVIAPPVERLDAVFPEGRVFREQAEPFRYLAVHDTAGVLLGYMATSDLCGTTGEGYMGPVPVRVFTDPGGVLLDYDVLPNDEDPGYLVLIADSDLKQRLLRWRVDGEDTLDAVTMATFTSTAIINSVTTTLTRLRYDVIEPAAAGPR